jgi:multidrug resistance efflux pump
MSRFFDDPPPFDDETQILPGAQPGDYDSDPTLLISHLPPLPDHPRSRPSAVAVLQRTRAQMTQASTQVLHAVQRRDPRVFIAAGAVALVVIVLLVVALIPSAPARQSVVGMAFQGNLTQTVTTSGQLSSGIYNLSFFASGRIDTIDVQVGQTVTAGTVLAQLDVTQLQDALNTAQAQVAVAQVAYNNALIGLTNAQNNQTAVDAAAQDAYNAVATPQAGQSTPTPQQVQAAQDTLHEAETQAQNQVNAAQAQVDLTKSQVAAAQTEVDAAQHNLANSTLRAPVDGQVADVNANVGEVVGSGGTTGPLIVLVNLNTLQASGYVDELRITQVQVGWPVAFTVRAFPNDTFYGIVAAVSPIPHQDQQGNVSYQVSVAIDSQSAAQARLFPAMTVPTITLTTNEAFGAILIPNAALNAAQDDVRTGKLSTAAAQTATQQAQQLIVNAADSATKEGVATYVAQWHKGALVAIPIVIGISDGTDTVVLAGLNVGDPVVLSAG